MWLFRALAGALGASGSLVAAGVIVIAVLSGALAFHGWPTSPAPGDGLPVTEIASGPAARVADAGATAAPTPTADLTRVGSAGHPAARRAPRASGPRGRTHVREQRNGRAPEASRPKRSSSPAPSGGGSAPDDDGGDAPAKADATPRTPRTPAAGSGPSTVPSVPTPPSVPSVPTPPSPPSPGQTVSDATQAVGGAVQQTTQTVADAVRPFAPPVSDAVQQVGQAAADAVDQAGDAVGGLLGGAK
jgi:hypothetical protein